MASKWKGTPRTSTQNETSYLVPRPPNPLNEFTEYRVTVHGPTSRVTGVNATGTYSSEFEMESAYSEVYEKLAKAYGSPRKGTQLSAIWQKGSMTVDLSGRTRFENVWDGGRLIRVIYYELYVNFTAPNLARRID